MLDFQLSNSSRRAEDTTLSLQSRPRGFLLVTSLILYSSIFAASASADDWEAGQIQVQLNPGVLISTINLRYGTTTLDALYPLYLLDLPDGQGEQDVVDMMSSDPDIDEVEFAYNNETPEGTRQMVAAAVGGTITDYLDQHLAARLRLDEAHAHTLGEGVTVAVLDTGVLATHPALVGSIMLGGWDFVDNDPDPGDYASLNDEDNDGMTDEGAGHGTMVAGIIHLVAPGAKILPIRVLDDEGRGDSFLVAKGIRYAQQHGARVINMSLGLQDHSFIIGHEVEFADSLNANLIAAVGNDSLDNMLYPSAVREVISVTALDSSDVKADFANWASDVFVSAPGVGVFAPYYDGEYAIGAGTSFAAPFVSGQCALIRSLNPALDKTQVREIALLGVVDIYQIPGNQSYQGKLGTGRFDAMETFLMTPGAAGVNGGPRRANPWVVWPNPSRAGGTVRLALAQASTGPVAEDASIVDASGRVISLLRRTRNEPSFLWNGVTTDGREAPSGVYFVRVPGASAVRIARIAR